MSREVYLQPGELYFGGGDLRLSTLLGSCISVTVWHPVQGLGGMCHFMLPSRSSASRAEFDGRYGDEALALFRREIAMAKTQPRDYQVGVFGGGNMFATSDTSPIDVGQRNIHAARQLLRRHGFAIDWEDVAGMGYRRLWLNLKTGNVHCVQVDGERQRVMRSGSATVAPYGDGVPAFHPKEPKK